MIKSFQISDYSVSEMLSLLNLPSSIQEITESDLKETYKKVSKLHPDKCELEPCYFILFHKMFQFIRKLSLSLWKESQDVNEVVDTRKQEREEENEYNTKHSSELEKQFQSQQEQGKHNSFLDTFNKEFVKTSASLLSKVKNIPTPKTGIDYTKEQHEIDRESEQVYKTMNKDVFDDLKKKRVEKEKNAMILFEGGYTNRIIGASYNEEEEDVEDYGGKSSGGCVFSDLKKSYDESILPVSEDLLRGKPNLTFETLQQLRHKEFGQYNVKNKEQINKYLEYLQHTNYPQYKELVKEYCQA